MNSLSTTPYSWKDGTPLIVPNRFEPICIRGNKQGQQINYFYCDSLGYSKKVINYDENGKIIESRTDNYRIKLILNVSSNNIGMKVYKIVSSKCIPI